jgi:hypothetical protein
VALGYVALELLPLSCCCVLPVLILAAAAADAIIRRHIGWRA